MAKLSPYLKKFYRRPLTREDGAFLKQIQFGDFIGGDLNMRWFPKDVDMLVYADHLDDRGLTFEAEAWRRLASRQNFPAFRNSEWCWFSRSSGVAIAGRPEYTDVSVLLRMNNGHYKIHGYAAYRRLIYALIGFVNGYRHWKTVVSDALESV